MANSLLCYVFTRLAHAAGGFCERRSLKYNSTARRNGALGAARQVHIASLFPAATHAIVPYLSIVLSMCVRSHLSPFSRCKLQVACSPFVSGRCTAVIVHCIYITIVACTPYLRGCAAAGQRAACLQVRRERFSEPLAQTSRIALLAVIVLGSQLLISQSLQ